MERSALEQEQKGKTTQTDTQLNHSSSGQRPKSHGEHAGDNPGGKHEQEEANRQGKPNRHPTLPQQLRSKTQKPRRASGRQSRRQSTNKNERTNMQSNPNRGPAQPQQLRSKTQKPRRTRGKPSRRQSTNKNERTSKATQTEAQLNHSSSGQRPKSHGEQAGINPGRNERGDLSSPVAAAVPSTRVKV